MLAPSAAHSLKEADFGIACIQIFDISTSNKAKSLTQPLHRFVRFVRGREQLFRGTDRFYMAYKGGGNTLPAVAWVHNEQRDESMPVERLVQHGETDWSIFPPGNQTLACLDCIVEEIPPARIAQDHAIKGANTPKVTLCSLLDINHPPPNLQIHVVAILFTSGEHGCCIGDRSPRYKFISY